MTGLPSHLFVVRHGNRLDAADKRWHLSSPTPYDPPLTYGGWLQARQVGQQISNYIENAKLDAENSRGGSPTDRKQKRYRVIIHSSPFVRCVQTSIAITSGLSQLSPEASFHPSELLAPVPTPQGKSKNDHRSSILRLDSYLGEWLSPEYFENITPPPSSSLMLGTAKADLLKREDYSAYTDFSPSPQPTQGASLWSGSPSRSPAADADASFETSSMFSALPRQSKGKGYTPPRPTYAVSSAGKIPEGFVAHARDACLAVDYQWDSMREPLNFGDGGKLGEEWTEMHKRFRGGLKRMLNWYATEEAPEKLVSGAKSQEPKSGEELSGEEEVETIAIIVSHGAGCNALIGAITHQPVLMDVGIASITMAVRKPDLDYSQLQSAAKSHDASSKPLVPVDQMYDIRLSASTEHLQSTNSTPVSSRSASTSNYWSHQGNPGSRGRTSTLGSGMGPSIGAFTYSDPFSLPGSRSTSASATVGNSVRRESGGSKPSLRQSAMASTGLFSGPGNSSGAPGGSPTGSSSPAMGLWTPTPSSLRLMDDGTGDSDRDDYKFPDFDQTRLQAQPTPDEPKPPFGSENAVPPPKKPGHGPTLSGPIKLQTNWMADLWGTDPPPEEVKIPSVAEGFGGLWGQPRPPGEAERNRDLSHTKRRWTVNERGR